MFVKNNLSEIFSTLLIVIIGVHFVKTLDEVTDKSSDGEHLNNNTSTDKLYVEPSNRRTRLLANFPSPVYMPSESKKSKKSIKSKKKKKYEKDTEEDDNEDNEGDEEEEDCGEKNGCKGAKISNKNKKKYNKPIIKYVPIPIYLGRPKPKTTRTPSPFGSMNSLLIDDLMPMKIGMKNVMPGTGGYGLMGMNAGNYGPLNFGTGSGYMGMIGGGLGNYGNYGQTDMISGYGGMGNSGGMVSNGNKNPNYVVAHYANTGNEYTLKEAIGCSPNGYGGYGLRMKTKPNGDECKPYGNSNEEGYSDNEMTQYGANQPNTGSDYGYNEDNYYENKPSKPKSYSKTNRKPKKRPPITTTTEEPTIEPDKEMAGETQQYEDNDTKAKQIAKMLEMLDKWN